MRYLVAVGCAVLIAMFGASQTWAHGGGGMGGITENDICAMERGQYFIHFSAYQHAANGTAAQQAVLQELKSADVRRYLDAMKEEFRSYCRDIPKTGKATLTFDLISDALRKIPVAVRVVEASERDNQATTVLYIPQQVYPSGVVKAETDFAKAGKYKAVVEVEEHPGSRVANGHDHVEMTVSQRHASSAEEEVYHAHDSSFSFPFTVGLKTPQPAGRSSSMLSNPGILVTAIAGVAVGSVLYVRRKKKTV